MRIVSLITLLPATCLAAVLPLRAQVPDLAITGVTIVDVRTGELIPDRTVLIHGQRILDVVAAGTVVPAAARVVDGRGRFLMPGLIDTHVHLAAWFGTPELEAELASLLAGGVTTVRDAAGIGREAALMAHAHAVERGEATGPRVSVSGSVSHQSVGRYGVAGLPELIRALHAAGVNGLKIRQGLSDDDLRTVFAEAAAVGLPVYGHTYDWPGRDAAPEYTMAAVLLGAAGVMHVSGVPQVGEDAPSPPAGPRFGPDNWQRWWLHQATLWLHGDRAAEDALIDTMVARGAWLEPTLVTEDWLAFADRYRSEWSARGLPRTHAEAFMGFPTWTGAELERFRGAVVLMQDFVRRFHERGGTVIAGSDCLPSCSQGVHEEVALLVAAGLSPLAALQAATLSAARGLGRGHELGAVEPGYLADLLLLDANPLDDVRNTRRIVAVIAGGRTMPAP